MANEPTGARDAFGDIAPKLAEVTDKVLFGDIWERPGLSPRDRSMITVSALIATFRPEELFWHMKRALANGVTQDELVEMITHLSFYTGWPNGHTAIVQLRRILDEAGQG